jgi:uncharacterized membrane protein
LRFAERGDRVALHNACGSLIGETQDARRTAVTAIAGRMTEQDRARELPHEHVPRLVVSRDVSGEGPLDRVADRVNRLVGSMWLFVGVSVGIVAWLFAGNVVGFDRTPWPLLLTVLNLPQLSIMISLQVSANRAQAASDARATADHSTLVALHELARRQAAQIEAQSRVLERLGR